MLRLACLLSAAVLIAGCGGASQSASSSATTASHVAAKKPRRSKTAHGSRTRSHASGSSRFPAATEAAFRRTCANYVRQRAVHVPLQFQATIPLAISTYCTCTLDKVEASVSVQRFKHDLLAIVYGQGTPGYVSSAERACSGELQAELGLLPIA